MEVTLLVILLGFLMFVGVYVFESLQNRSSPELDNFLGISVECGLCGASDTAENKQKLPDNYLVIKTHPVKRSYDVSTKIVCQDCLEEEHTVIPLIELRKEVLSLLEEVSKRMGQDIEDFPHLEHVEEALKKILKKA